MCIHSYPDSNDHDVDRSFSHPYHALNFSRTYVYMYGIGRMHTVVHCTFGIRDKMYVCTCERIENTQYGRTYVRIHFRNHVFYFASLFTTEADHDLSDSHSKKLWTNRETTNT